MTSQNKMKDYPLNKTIVKVFPDYLSTGLWINHTNVDVERFNFNSEVAIALKYWHMTWEFLLAHYRDGNLMSNDFTVQWIADGGEIVDAMNVWADIAQIPYTFVYEVTEA